MYCKIFTFICCLCNFTFTIRIVTFYAFGFVLRSILTSHKEYFTDALQSTTGNCSLRITLPDETRTSYNFLFCNIEINIVLVCWWSGVRGQYNDSWMMEQSGIPRVTSVNRKGLCSPVSMLTNKWLKNTFFLFGVCFWCWINYLKRRETLRNPTRLTLCCHGFMFN